MATHDIRRVTDANRDGVTLSLPSTCVTAERRRTGEPVTRRRNVRSLMKARLPARLFSLLRQAGDLAEQRHVPVYAVGGFVRDVLRGAPTLDVDVTVEGNGIDFARAFARRQRGRVTTHPRFGTATVTCADGCKIDVASTRRERYDTPTALPTVWPSSLAHDVARRDFTINTLAVRLNTPWFGDVVDHADGLRDLNAGVIRVLHDRSFMEDPTRVFRAIRFARRLGFRLSDDTAVLLRAAVRGHFVQRLSPSRLSDAVRLVLSERDPGHVLAGLADAHLLPLIHPRLTWSPGLARLFQRATHELDTWHRQHHPDRPVRPWVVYGMALLTTLPQPAMEDALARLRFPLRDARQIQRVGREGGHLLRTLRRRPRAGLAATHRLLRAVPDETIIFLMAKTRSAPATDTLSAFAASHHVTPSITGKDLRAMGLTPSPLYRQILDRLRNARLNGAVTTKAAERRLVDRITKRDGTRRKAKR